MCCFHCLQSLLLYSCRDKPGIYFILSKRGTAHIPTGGMLSEEGMPSVGLGGHLACLLKCFFLANQVFLKSSLWYVTPTVQSTADDSLQ